MAKMRITFESEEGNRIVECENCIFAAEEKDSVTAFVNGDGRMVMALTCWLVNEIAEKTPEDMRDALIRTLFDVLGGTVNFVGADELKVGDDRADS